VRREADTSSALSRTTLRKGIRDNRGVIRFSFDVKFVPTVDEARPRHCVSCRVGAYESDRLRIYGHGLVERQQRGPSSPGDPAGCAVAWIRRFLCKACGAAMRVVPGSLTPGKHFSGAAIGFALALWSAGRSAAEVREEVSDWKVIGSSARGWRTLSRWARDVGAGKLFGWLALGAVAGGPHHIASRAAQALRGYAPLEGRSLPIWHQSQLGACHVS
jgi:hypothetical protein